MRRQHFPTHFMKPIITVLSKLGKTASNDIKMIQINIYHKLRHKNFQQNLSKYCPGRFDSAVEHQLADH